MGRSALTASAEGAILVLTMLAGRAAIRGIGACCNAIFRCTELIGSDTARSKTCPVLVHGAMRALARVLHAQLFAALLGIGVPAVASYVATWFVARHTGLAHGFHCQLQTTAAAALILFAASGDGHVALCSVLW